MDINKITIELTPFEALQILRFEKFIHDAVKDPLNKVKKWDAIGITKSLRSVTKQTIEQISVEQLKDAFAEKSVNQLINS